ncbi:MAG: tetratricopeptide repeat protein [Parcubacteria group bacterium]
MKKFGKNKIKNLKIAGISIASVFVLVLAVGFIFQNQIRKTASDRLITRGNYYFNNGAYDTKKSERYFSWALRLNPQADAAYYQLSRIHLVGNELDLARNEIDRSLAINPQNQRAFYIRGLINAYDKKYDDAISDFQKFVAWAPAEWAGYNDLAWVYSLNKDFENTKNIAQVGLDKTGDRNPWLLDNLGVAYINLGESKKAEEIFAKVKDISGDMTAEEWAMAYPGNDPSLADMTLGKFKTDVDTNSQLALGGFISGGIAVSACGSSGGGGYNGACGIGGSKNGIAGCNSKEDSKHCGNYINSCGALCTGSGSCCTPNCACAASTCVGGTCADGCGGSCAGTKAPTYSKTCLYSDTGNSCGQNNCNQKIILKKAYCTNVPNNGCGSQYTLPISQCSSFISCHDQEVTCPPCSWKEVAP